MQMLRLPPYLSDEYISFIDNLLRVVKAIYGIILQPTR